MATAQPFPIESQPGIKQDCTLLEGSNYSAGTWCRFSARARPRKIAGYQAITSRLNEIVRGMDSYTSDLLNYVHMGSQSQLTQVQVGSNGALGLQTNRTPAGFAANANNLWQFSAMQDKVGGTTALIAHAAQSLNDIANQTETPIYYGNINDTSQMLASAMDPVSGGVVAVPPYIMAYSNGGRVDLSALNDPTQPTSQSTFVTSQKIVKGLALRNTTGPAALLWALDAVITAFFDPTLTAAAGGIPTFDFNEVSDDSSILSEQGVIEYDSIYYWAGVDRFLMFNGIVRELPNNMNIDFFFDNMNYAYRQKVFAFKVPRWGEIWWCFPMGSATECNHAVIFNTRLQIWYDTPLPDGGRSAGLFAKVYTKPFMCDVDLTNTGYTLWQHETGFDKVIGSTIQPILSSFTTHEISPILLPPGQGAQDKAYRVSLLEADFNQSGDINCVVLNRANARTEQVASTPILIPELTPGVVPSAAEQITRISQNARLLAFQFTSNEPGGDYEMGHTIGHIEPTDGRITQ